MHDLGYDAVHDELVVTSSLAQAILTFRGGANGEEAPLRIIQGPHTQILAGAGALAKVTVDPVHNEYLVPGAPDTVLVFPREGKGDVAPLRVLRGPDTQIRYPDLEGGDNPPVGVDPVHDLLIVATRMPGRRGGGEAEEEGASSDSPFRRGVPGALLIFDRTASGNAKPRAVIGGPQTGIGRVNQIAVYPPKGWIVASTGNSLCVWSINDNGDVPPRWRIPVQKITGGGSGGVALDPVHKEIIAPDSANNSVITFYFPEIF